jgi:uncharacterized protein YnzC (UPF0291/DUF896 family)
MDRLTRINELYHKSQIAPLSEEEKEEQARLRKEYIDNVRKNLRGSLEQMSFVNPDGSITKVSDLKKSK